MIEYCCGNGSRDCNGHYRCLVMVISLFDE